MIYSHTRWAELLRTSMTQIENLATLKGGEYAGDQDRLANFRRNGLALDLDMETVWAVYAGKHWDALQQYIRDLRAEKTRTRLEPIAGRVDDLLVYLLLFKAMIEERNDLARLNKEATDLIKAQLLSNGASIQSPPKWPKL